MKKVNYHLAEKQLADLRKEAAESGRSMAETIRRAIDFYLDDQRRLRGVR
jgi:hypothetical protein